MHAAEELTAIGKEVKPCCFRKGSIRGLMTRRSDDSLLRFIATPTVRPRKLDERNHSPLTAIQRKTCASSGGG